MERIKERFHLRREIVWLRSGHQSFYPQDRGTRSSKTSVPIYQTREFHIPEEANLYGHSHQNLESFFLSQVRFV
jgi:hypothetical protein